MILQCTDATLHCRLESKCLQPICYKFLISLTASKYHGQYSLQIKVFLQTLFQTEYSYLYVNRAVGCDFGCMFKVKDG